jgi:quinohemoprotein ethanol dehydrogenase
MYFPASQGGSGVFAVNRDFVPKPGLPPVVRVGVNTGGAANAVEPSGAIGPTPAAGQRGTVLLAWDPVAQKERWHADGGGGGGALTTAGNLVFHARGDGHLLAYRADDGTKLLDLESGLGGGIGPPITFNVDGKQHIALMGNPGGGQRGAAAAATPAPAPKIVVFALK